MITSWKLTCSGTWQDSSSSQLFSFTRIYHETKQLLYKTNMIALQWARTVKRKKSLLSVALILTICLIAISLYFQPRTLSEKEENDVSDPPLALADEDGPVPKLVIPEVPLGTLTAVIALMTGFIAFARLKRTGFCLS